MVIFVCYNGASRGICYCKDTFIMTRTREENHRIGEGIFQTRGFILTFRGLFLSISLLSALYISQIKAYSQDLVSGTRDETITAMKADSLGMLYFSTLRGLSSYDGRNITQIVTDENVNDFVVEDDGTIWFCGQSYLAKVSPDKSVRRFPLSSFQLSHLVRLPDNRLAFLHHSGLSVFDTDSLRVVSNLEETTPKDASVSFDPASGRIWMASGNKVRLFDKDLNPGATVHLPAGSTIRSMVPVNSPGTCLVLASSRGLFALGEDLKVRQIGQNVTGGGNILFASSVQSDSTIVTAVQGKGLFRIGNDLTVEPIQSDYDAETDSVLGFLMDDGHLWVSPDEVGVYLVSLADTHGSGNTNPIESFFAHKRIDVLCRDSRQAVWAVAGGTVYRFLPATGEVRRIVIPVLDDGYVNTLLVTSDDCLVVCSSDTVFLFEIGFTGTGADDVQLEEIRPLRQALSVHSLIEVPGKELVFRTYQGDFTLTADGMRKPSPTNAFPLFSDPYTKTVVRSSGNRISFATDGQEISNSPLLPEGKNARLAFVDSHSSLWCVTNDIRLFKIRPFEGIVEEYELPKWQPVSVTQTRNPLIHSAQEDNDGNLWLGTSYGLVKIDPDDKEGFQLYNTGRKYDYYTASCKDADGHLYFAYSNGLTIFDTESENHLSSNALIRFSIYDILVNNVSVKGRTLPSEFAYTENTFTFVCSFVDYDNLQARYVWKLEGYDDDWQYGTLKYASYPNLPPGNYRFLLKIEGMPDSMSQSYAFTIRRKPWLSRLAIILYILAALTLLTLASFSVRWRQKKKEEERIQALTRQVDRMKLDVFTNLSHEFRSPLTLISVPLKDMLYDEALSGEPRAKLMIMERNVEKLQRLTDQLLEYDRIDKDFSRLDLRRKDIVRDLSEIAESFQYTALKSGATITVGSSSDSIPFVYDDIKIGRVMSNLLSNAIKYSPEGGEIHVSVSMIPARDAARVYGYPFTSDCLEVAVTDHGQGIPPDKLEQIFDKYSRANDPGIAGVQGFGIGLHYTRQLLQAHGGHIIAERNQPTGSVFRFVIPDNLQLSEKTGQETPEQDTTDPSPALRNDGKEYFSGLNILVVDDNDDLREYVMKMFGATNNVTGASDGQKGLEAARAQYFDIVISDVMMPVMDGYSLCKAIKEDSELCAMSVILLTAKTDTLSQVHGLNIGADAYVSKPFDPMYLRALVNSIARRRVQRQDAIVRATSRTLDSLPEEVVPDNAFDKKFLTDLYAILDGQLEQEEIDINGVVRDMCMSRTSFYMKLKALTGQSPLQFINEYRMSRAAELLKSGNYSIKEVALMVGYQERRSFTNRFKTTFGRTPTEYLG